MVPPGNGNPQNGGNIPDRYDCPIRQHFGGPTTKFVNVFSQPGNYQVSLNLTEPEVRNHAQPNTYTIGNLLDDLAFLSPPPRQPGCYTIALPPMAQTQAQAPRNGDGVMGPATPRANP